MASNIYLADLIQSKSLTNFQSLLEALNNDPNLADATKKSLKGTTANLQISTESQYQILKTKLRTQWEGYTAPTKTVNTHISEFNKYFLDKIPALPQQAGQQQPQNQLCLPPVTESYHQVGFAFYAVKPEDLSVDQAPLINPLTPTLDHFINCIIKLPGSESVNLYESLTRLLSAAAPLGYSRESLSTVFKILAQKHFPEIFSLVEAEQDPGKVFDIMLGSVDFPRLGLAIKTAINEIKRSPGDSLHNTIHLYKSLLIETYKLTCPNSTTLDIQNRAEEETKRGIKFFIEPQSAAELKNFNQAHRSKLGSKATLDEILTFLSLLEQSSDFSLQSEKTLRPNLQHVDLFNTSVTTPDRRNTRGYAAQSPSRQPAPIWPMTTAPSTNRRRPAIRPVSPSRSGPARPASPGASSASAPRSPLRPQANNSDSSFPSPGRQTPQPPTPQQPAERQSRRDQGRRNRFIYRSRGGTERSLTPDRLQRKPSTPRPPASSSPSRHCLLCGAAAHAGNCDMYRGCVIHQKPCPACSRLFPGLPPRYHLMKDCKQSSVLNPDLN